MLGATILFSAKETVFKAQYPLTQRMLGHQDVEIVVSADWCAWVATLTQAAGESHPSAGAMGTPETWEGRLLEEAGMVATCVVIPAR